jgi:hypothetical protein
MMNLRTSSATRQYIKDMKNKLPRHGNWIATCESSGTCGERKRRNRSASDNGRRPREMTCREGLAKGGRVERSLCVVHYVSCKSWGPIAQHLLQDHHKDARPCVFALATPDRWVPLEDSFTHFTSSNMVFTSFFYLKCCSISAPWK